MLENLTDEERVAKQRELIEAWGRIVNRMGQSALSGRIIGLLTCMDKEEFTFEEIIDELKISKSSASTVINYLLDTEKIEYVTYAGDRKRYFRIKVNTRQQFLNSILSHIKKVEKINRIALELKQDKNSRTSKQLAAMIEDMTFWKNELKRYEDEFLQDEI